MEQKYIVLIDEEYPPGWVKKYTVEKHWPFGHNIIFEENPLAWYLWERDADAICAMLNGAYNIGRSDRKLEYIFDGEKIDTAVRDLIDATDIGSIGGYGTINLDDGIAGATYVAVNGKKFFNIKRKAKALAQLLGKEYRKWQRPT